MSSQTWSTAGVYYFTVPLGVTSIQVESWGAGGGGCGYPVNGGGSGGGGGGGAYTLSSFAVVAGQVVEVIVGAGGAAGSGDGGVYGEDSGVMPPGYGGMTGTASGGQAAYRRTGGQGGNAYATWPGGRGGNGKIDSPPYLGGGGGGGAATGSGSGTDGYNGLGPLPFAGGSGGTFGGGNGGAYSAGVAGTAPGGGGGGGGQTGYSTGTAGGAGADGQVTITYTANSFQFPMTGVAKIAVSQQFVMTGKARITNVPQSGYSVIRFATAPLAGHSISVSYRRLGADLIVCENTPDVAARAAVEGGTGKYQTIRQDTANTDQYAGLQETQQDLQTYGTMPTTIKLQTYRAGIMPGMYLRLDMAGAAQWNLPAYLDGYWFVQEVDAEFIPGMPDRTGPGMLWSVASLPWTEAAPWTDLSAQMGCLLYTLTLISQPKVANWVDFWINLARKK